MRQDDFDDAVRRIKDNYKLRDILAEYGITLNRAGFCGCPFHSGDNTPSMKIYDNNTFHCFGCGANGSVIDFVMKMDGLSFRDACRRLSGGDPFEQDGKKPSREKLLRQIALAKMKRRDEQKKKQYRNKRLAYLGGRLRIIEEELSRFSSPCDRLYELVEEREQLEPEWERLFYNKDEEPRSK